LSAIGGFVGQKKPYRWVGVDERRVIAARVVVGRERVAVVAREVGCSARTVQRIVSDTVLAPAGGAVAAPVVVCGAGADRSGDCGRGE
jgi:hypothetical protein